MIWQRCYSNNEVLSDQARATIDHLNYSCTHGMMKRYRLVEKSGGAGIFIIMAYKDQSDFTVVMPQNHPKKKKLRLSRYHLQH